MGRRLYGEVLTSTAASFLRERRHEALQSDLLRLQAEREKNAKVVPKGRDRARWWGEFRENSRSNDASRRTVIRCRASPRGTSQARPSMEMTWSLVRAIA